MTNVDRPCSNCGESDWKEVPRGKQSYMGAKGNPRDRDETERHLYECKSCGAEGKKFIDGVSGDITWSGALR